MSTETKLNGTPLLAYRSTKRGDSMSYDEIKEYIGKKVVLTDIDNKKFRGVITNTESEFDTTSGKEEIELDTGKVCYGIPFDEIKTILVERHTTFGVSFN